MTVSLSSRGTAGAADHHSTIDCFHCGEAVPEGLDLRVRIDEEDQPVCCHGCQAVASLILDSGLDAFYRYRPEATGRPEDTPLDSQAFCRFDEERIQEDFTHQHADGSREAALLVDGLYCAACGWLIERSLDDAEGVEEIRVNPATGRALLRWRPDRVRLSHLMGHMSRLGYQPQPVLPEAADSQAQKERRSAMRRLIVAGLGMMQAMMFAVALYAGQFHGMEASHEQFLRLVSLLVATPVILYAGLPIFMGAIRDLKNLAPGMDVPVSLAIGTGYFASAWVTFFGGPEVYFDSIAMFTFFLLVARYVEMAARHRANATTDALARLVPDTAIRLNDGEGEEQVPVRELRVGDRVLVRPGSTIPADGVLLAGDTRVDESMLTGESRPLSRGAGDPLIGGSLNVSHPVTVRVTRTGQDGTVAHIGRLLSRAQAERPGLTRLADRVARVFVTLVLIASATVFAIWWHVNPAMAFPVTLAMLIATCPCALSLATPTALAAGTNHMAGRGLLVTRSDALETLAKVTHVVLDKTGTLTRGELRIVETRTLGNHGESDARALAAALEKGSEHPLARAFDSGRGNVSADAVETHRGQGVEGMIHGRRHRIGRPDWVAELSATHGLDKNELDEAWVALGSEAGAIALFRLDDPLRDDATETMARLKALGLQLEILSGDAVEPVRRTASAIGISHWQARMSPEDKLERVRELQKDGAIVLMVGDGINDAPVLAGANISAALNQGTALAQTSAGMISLGDRLGSIADGVSAARRTLRTIRQNLAFSATYNASMLPLAALGLVAPYVAAAGMTLSSVVVVLNARRLGKTSEQ
ncbi:heavy metal translocating P-type ATPase [Natronospira bacteriovora]|uniref:Heavy metal translocating P-type ATPase n=1 Tax=Natronospira bacteriovora TaxID=3069753 RepID=A0ABU0W9H6_9GAMM|nr:heavy metal translocating P-type ATPase [Natronospira sp. AB-CW4]MDQ2070408.1 heavy metal translocating P-type ATPase [Natronospira sp. AB-CW4]